MQARGLQDTMKLASEEIQEVIGMKEIYQEVIVEINNNKIDFKAWETMLVDLATKVIEVEKIGVGKELYWNKKLKEDVEGFLEEINEFFPWFHIAL